MTTGQRKESGRYGKAPPAAGQDGAEGAEKRTNDQALIDVADGEVERLRLTRRRTAGRAGIGNTNINCVARSIQGPGADQAGGSEAQASKCLAIKNGIADNEARSV